MINRHFLFGILVSDKPLQFVTRIFDTDDTLGRKGRELGIETKDMVNMSRCDSIVSFITENFFLFRLIFLFSY